MDDERRRRRLRHLAGKARGPRGGREQRAAALGARRDLGFEHAILLGAPLAVARRAASDPAAHRRLQVVGRLHEQPFHLGVELRLRRELLPLELRRIGRAERRHAVDDRVPRQQQHGVKAQLEALPQLLELEQVVRRLVGVVARREALVVAQDGRRVLHEEHRHP
eukprot:1221069-Prymnesium_polylepis.1